MADGTEYPANFEDDSQNVRLAGAIQFTDDANQPVPLAEGVVAADVQFDGDVGFYGTTPVAQPVVPLTTPDAQDVIDALIALGLVSQSD